MGAVIIIFSILAVIVLALFFIGALTPAMRLVDEREAIERVGFERRQKQVNRIVKVCTWIVVVSTVALVISGTLTFFEFRGDRFADGVDRTDLYVYSTSISGFVFLTSSYMFLLFRGSKRALKRIMNEYLQ